MTQTLFQQLVTGRQFFAVKIRTTEGMWEFQHFWTTSVSIWFQSLVFYYEIFEYESDGLFCKWSELAGWLAHEKDAS